MKPVRWFLASAFAGLLFSFSPLTLAQAHVYIPGSSMSQPRNEKGDVMARTTLRILAPSAAQLHFGAQAAQPQELPPFAGYFYETPASIACVYKLVEVTVNGCNPNVTTANPTGGNKAIAIVDAFDDPTAASDLATFSSQFGIAAADFTVVYAQGTVPGEDPTGGWEIEESLDIEWAHAMAPAAKIFLVEAKNNSFTNLFNAVVVASNLVAANGGGEVSMSWGGGEFASETLYDAFFSTPKVVYFASAGDSPGTLYPSVSPNVVSAGGTSISRDSASGKFLMESSWQDAGGGPSLVEPRPSFQNGVKSVVGATRGTPDLSFDANPNTGVWVYDTNTVLGIGWYVVGGTSVSSPSLAGIVNAANSFLVSSPAENTLLYNGKPKDFNDITYGNCGLYISNLADNGYDPCTGIGTVKTLKGK